MTDHSEFENSVAAFVLGASEADEMEAVRAHLAGCAECRLLAERLQRAADVLPLATELVEPPARLKSQILAAATASAGSTSKPAAPAGVLKLPLRAVGSWGGRPGLGLNSPTAAVAALTVVVLGLGAWNLHLADQLNRQQSSIASTTLSGQGELSGAIATIVDFKAQSVALVTFKGLPPPPSGKVYELWLIGPSGVAEGVAVFQPEPDGTKAVVLNRNLRQYRAIAMTVEAGPSGVAAPTQTPSLSGSTV